MRIFLLNTHTISPETLLKWEASLPPFRASTVTKANRVQAVAGFYLVRYAIQQLDPDANTEHWVTGVNGKPALSDDKGPFFNLTHTAHCIAVAVSNEEEVGIDLEEVKPRHPGFAARYFSPEEQAAVLAATDPTSELIRIWSAKEAEAKRTGLGLSQGIAAIPTHRAQSVQICINAVPHWLSVAPTTKLPTLEWVDGDILTVHSKL